MPDTVRCPRRECSHPINDHIDSRRGEPSGCVVSSCTCRVDPNTIALAAVQTALFGDLTPAPTRVSRQPEGSWS